MSLSPITIIIGILGGQSAFPTFEKALHLWVSKLAPYF